MPDVLTGKIITELKIRDWFDVGDLNLVPCVKHSKVSAIILSCTLKGLLLMKLKMVLKQSSRQEN